MIVENYSKFVHSSAFSHIEHFTDVMRGSINFVRDWVGRIHKNSSGKGSDLLNFVREWVGGSINCHQGMDGGTHPVTKFYGSAIQIWQGFFYLLMITLVNVYVDLMVFTRIAGTS